MLSNLHTALTEYKSLYRLFSYAGTIRRELLIVQVSPTPFTLFE